MQIFGKELYEDASLAPLYRELLGISGIKPFECVGTNEEMILAMQKFYQQSTIQKKEHRLPIMEIFESEILPTMSDSDFENLEKKLIQVYNENNIPAEIQKILPR